MKNFVCWEPRAVREVINPFAEHMPDALFRAVHSDWNLMVSPRVGKAFQEVTEASYVETTSAAFLSDFMRSDRQHVLAAVLGETGSGKSHLVHWMRMNLKSDDKTLVLTVRKSGTSLRAIVRMIIDQLAPEDQQGFLDTLNASGDGTASRDGQKQQLLNDLAQTIREEVLPPDADEVEVELVRSLPNLFQDPHIRATHFLGDDTIIAEIVDHIFAQSTAADRPDKRRTFSVEDLQLGGGDYLSASQQARDAIQVIELDPSIYRPLAVTIINRNLDRATARTLSFTGDRVEELMTRLRAHLKDKGQELVLLVEEFARLQGIDRALLQTMTTHGDERLCKMRSAIAVTTGFFGSVAETAYMRTTHIVDMDRSAGRTGGRQVSSANLSLFASRYLNAVRLGPDAVEAWSKTAELGDTVPSACENCPHHDECHAIFGQVDDYGLYPFTETALVNGAGRVDLGFPERLNPRILQNDLLVEVLDNGSQSLSLGQFPSPELMTKLGGVKRLSLTAQSQLTNANPQRAERWMAFLELYDGSGKVVKLDQALHDALDVPTIPGANEIAATAPMVIEGATGESGSPLTVRASREDIAIEKWIAGEGLDQTVAQTLRTLLFAAITEAVDWDMIGLSKTVFSGKSQKSFQTGSISFERQNTQVQEHVAIKLRIPGTHADAAVTGLALQGLIRASKGKQGWEFPDGEKMLPAFLDCLDAWVSSVEAQLLHISAPSPDWAPSAAALELLCVTAAIGGRLKADASIADMADAAFTAPPPDCPGSAPELRSVFDKLLKNREKLMTVARSRISSQKGGQVGAMLDPRRYVPTIRALRQARWGLRLSPPANDVSETARLYREIAAALPQAAEAEWTLRRQWLQDMDDAFGDGATRATIVSGLTSACQAVSKAALNTRGTAQTLGEALETFKTVYFDDMVLASRSLAKIEAPLEALPHYGRGRRNAVEAGTRLRKAAQAYLDSVDQNLGAYGADHQAKHDALSGSLSEIDKALEQIEVSLVDMIGAGDSDAA